MRKLILRSFLSPGDIVMLTAAVRDLHKCYPNRYLTDVRTPCPQLWENNPYLTPLAEPVAANPVRGGSKPGREEASRLQVADEVIDCEYPLIHRSNTEPWHFIHGFTQFLSDKLRVPIRPGPFKGDIHISPLEKSWMSQVQEITKEPVPFWVVVAGGKRDFTIKWWAHGRFQKVVDHFKGKILFVQVGEKAHQHPPLQGALDLRGKTDLRQLVRLVYHAQGVLCPVTLLMHLAAAVETKPGMPKNRACVVVAGGREPMQWEAYPHHQYIHTNGALLCCDNGGCWKSRTVPLGDGDEKDNPDKLCADVVPSSNGAARPLAARNALAYPREQWPHLLPRCMDMITAEEVIRRVESYFTGGVLRYLTETGAQIAERAL
jgi:ADP-heptose:LPS heptosyltransferase